MTATPTITRVFPEQVVHAHHRAARAHGWMWIGVGIAVGAVAGASGTWLWEPLWAGTFLSILALVVGAVMVSLSRKELRRPGDLTVRLEGTWVTARAGSAEPWISARHVHSVSVEPKTVALSLADGPPHVLSLPVTGSEQERLVAELEPHGIPIIRPERAPLKRAGMIAGIVLAVGVGGGALLLGMKAASLLVLGGIIAGIRVVAPDDPQTQALLFLGLGAVCGLLLLGRTALRWFRR